MNNTNDNSQGANTSSIPDQLYPVEIYLEKIGRDYSLRNLKALRETFDSRSDYVASFVGAGASKVLGVPDWSNLMSALAGAVPEGEKAAYEDLINNSGGTSVDPSRFPEIAGELCEILGPIEYSKIITQQIEHTLGTSYPTMEYVVLAIKLHLTTNFERCVEDAYLELRNKSQLLNGDFDRCPDVKYYTQATDYPTQSNPDWLCYLHAELEADPPIYILREEDYKTIYKHAGGADQVHDCLRHFYRNNHIVFLGFSFDDPFVSRCFHDIAASEKRNEEIFRKQFEEYGRDHKPETPCHFLLIDSGWGNRLWHNTKEPADSEDSSSAKEAYFKRWREIGVLPIVYTSGKHIFLQYLFEELARMRKS